MRNEHRASGSAPDLDWPVLVAGLVPPLLVAVGFWCMVGQLGEGGLRDAIAVRDALILWTGGLFARAGDVATIFDPHAYRMATRAMFGSGFGVPPWAYPPPMLLLAVPVSYLPIKYGFLAWSAAGTALLWFGARAAGLGQAARIAAVFSPAAAESLLGGQNGSLTAALLLPGLVLLGNRPWIAGTLLGGLIVKPQLAVLLPICLVASRNWRAGAGAALSASAIAGLSGLAFGWSSWADFLLKVAPWMRRVVLEAPWSGAPYQAMIATPFTAARWAGASLLVAYAVQAVLAVGAALLCWRAWRDPGADRLARAALTLALTFLVTPYGYSYDMPALAAALIGLAARGRPWRRGGRWGERILFAVAWIWPGCGFLFGALHGPPLGLAAVACAATLAWRACCQERLLPGAALGAAAG